ncbi:MULTISPECIES: right-handed parallel beta-helix repeat-containing protein [Halorussus]|uniref:right-handed parallel beta-helix repeat-containing protein n=1 Tax=Halorussus TaxID=1070314 RepID=UPI0020A1DA08|nr:right-handed parallel beta-helix repeat-containing protein [Halorussus vallis]USZ76931.1 right-handed parallel beta-helix repeat-containing protein [Halorussus vallis]
MTRRGLFALAGIAGLGLATSGTAAAHDDGGATGFDALDSVHIVGDGPGQYDTIQEAHDDIPGAGAEGNGAILIADSYDPSNEVFPIVVDKYADIRGLSSTGVSINNRSSANTFVFKATEQHNTESPKLSNVRLIGGEHAIVIEGHVGMTVEGVTIWDCAGDGIRIKDNSYSSTCYDNYFRNICIAGPGSDGVYVANGSAPHSLVFDNVNVYRAGNYGYQFRQAGAGTTVQNSTIQHCENWGMLVERSACFTARDCYFERNGEKYATGSGAKIDICFHNNGENDNFLVEGCYFNGMGEGVNAIHLNSGECGELRNCHFNGYDGGYIVQDAGHRDLNVARSTICTDGSETNFYGDGDPLGTRTREDGIVTRQDLSNTEGCHEGDKGIHDGSGSAPEGFALWLDGRWVSQVNGEVIS